MRTNPVISIITVVYNDVIHIEGTIRSVLEQSYSNIEYLIIDGASKDGTLDLIQKYASKISRLISEPDKGIYDAMNKGLALASGDYVLFLNSGDRLYHPGLFTQIFNELGDSFPDVIYGETMIVAEDGTEIGLRRLKAPEILSWKSLQNGMVVCHQSFLAKRALAPVYDARYRLSADFEWMLSILKKAGSIHNTHQIVAAFLDGGTSKNNIIKSLKERFRIMSEHYGFFSTLFQHVLIGLRFWIYFFKNKRF